MTRHIPNLLTCANLVCGCLGILSLSTTPAYTAYYVWAACIFDFFDGFAARLLRVSSPIGKELDSLADVVSFGVLPSLFIFHLIEEVGPSYLSYVAILIAVCSALRLAIFNLDTTQTDSFRGLPTPANALFLTGLPFLTPLVPGLLANPWILVAIAVVFSLLLVSRIELFALKFKNFGWADNALRYVFLLLAAIMLAVFQMAAVPLVILLYIGLSLVARVMSK